MRAASDISAALTEGRRPYLILVLLCLCFYLPGLVALPVTDRDEARFAQASRQMLASGNAIDIRFQDEPRYKKPIGIYWLQAASAALTVGPDKPAIWAYRLPSVAGAMLAVLLTFFFGQSLFDRRTALLAAALLGSSLLLTVEAHLAKTDAMLLASVVAMEGALGRLYLSGRRGEDGGSLTALVVWFALGAGILIKGPVSVAIFLLTVGTLAVADRSLSPFRFLRPGRGLLLLCAMVLPWFLAIGLTTHGEFLKTAVGTDILPKLLGGQESHGAPPGFYLLLFPALFWPASLFAIRAFWPSLKAWDHPSVRFCLAWVVPTWLMFELAPTKLAHYVLPTFPAIALLTAHFLWTAKTWQPSAARWPARGFLWLVDGLWALIGLALGAGLLGLPYALNGTVSPAGVLAVLGGIFVVFVVFRFRRRDVVKAAALAAVGNLLITVPAFHAVMPGLQGPWISRDVSGLLQKYAPPPEHPFLAAVGYHEPSLVFMAGTDTALTDPEGAAADLKAHGGGFALITRRREADFRAAAEAQGLKLKELASIHGYNYSRGKWRILKFFVVEGP